MDNLHIICLDRGHKEYCEQIYPKFRSVNQGWLLGPVKEIIPYEERTIDLLFTGTCPNEKEILKQAREFYNADWANIILDDIIQSSIERPNVPMTIQMKNVLGKNNIEISKEEYAMLMNSLGQYAEFYLRAYYRKKIVKLLIDAGIKIHVAGNGWEHLYEETPSNLIILGVVDFAKTAELIGNAKILLNIMPWFKDGIHDRILTAMHNETVCLSDLSGLCQELFEDGKNIMYYDLEHLEKLSELIKDLQADVDKVKMMVRNGKEVISKYTWDTFVEKYILDLLSLN